MAVREDDIRPPKILADYLELAAADARTLFADGPRDSIDCPACSGSSHVERFVKLGFRYVECERCGTLFVNPRPRAEVFARYYRESESARFWASDFYRSTEDVRRVKLIRPKAQRILDLLPATRPRWAPAVAVDVGAGYGVFCEELRALAPDWPIVAIEPGPSLAAVCRAKGLAVVPAFVEDVAPALLPPGEALVTCFELLEHVHDPLAFCRQLARLLAGGVLVLTTLSGRGFDIGVLGARSKAVHPPHHINFFNPDSLTRLFARAGLQMLQVFTPGQLDVDIVRKQPADVADPFLRRIVEADEATRVAFQEFLQAHRLSSHMWAIASQAP